RARNEYSRPDPQCHIAEPGPAQQMLQRNTFGTPLCELTHCVDNIRVDQRDQRKPASLHVEHMRGNHLGIGLRRRYTRFGQDPSGLQNREAQRLSVHTSTIWHFCCTVTEGHTTHQPACAANRSSRSAAASAASGPVRSPLSTWSRL